MKNRGCPNRYCCWESDCTNCEVGDKILKQQRKIKRLEEKIKTIKEIIRKATAREIIKIVNGYLGADPIAMKIATKYGVEVE